jgi:hypothetical protein
MINETKYGSEALNNNAGNDNTGLGAYAGYNNTDGSNNTVVGSNSSFYNTLGSNNTSVGAGSLCNNTIGSLNTAIGSSALEGVLNQSVGNENVAIGAQSLYINSGNLNTAIGTYSAVNVDGSCNTFLGANTTFDNISNIYQYSTALGYGATVTADNQIMMGSINNGIYPSVMVPGFDFTTVQSNQLIPKQYVDAVSQGLSPKGPVMAASTSTDGNIGSSYDLSAGTISGVSNTLILDGVSIYDGSAVLIKDQTDASANGIYIYNISGPGPDTSNLTRSSTMPVGSDATGALTFVQNGIVNGKQQWIQSNRPTPPSSVLIVGDEPLNFVEFFSLNFDLGEGLNLANVGGKTYLNVDSSLNFINFIDSDPSASQPGNQTTPATGYLALGTQTTNAIIIGPTGTSVPIQAQSVIQAQEGITGTTGSFTNLHSTDNTYLASSSSTNVGIGTTNPQYTLDVNGNGRFNNCSEFDVVNSTGIIRLKSDGISNYIESGFTGGTGITTSSSKPLIFSNYSSSTASMYLDTSNNRLGINKSNPTTTLDVIGNTTITSSFGRSFMPTASLIDSTSTNTLSFVLNANTGNYNPLVRLGDITITTQPVGTEVLTLTTNSNTTTGVRITSTSTVIGAGGSNSTPTASVTCNGSNVTINGTLMGQAGSLQDLTVSNQIRAPGGITGATGSFRDLTVSNQIRAPGGITGATGSFRDLTVSNQIRAPGGMTGATGSFRDLTVSNQIRAPGGMTGAIGSFTGITNLGYIGFNSSESSLTQFIINSFQYTITGIDISGGLRQQFGGIYYNSTDGTSATQRHNFTSAPNIFLNVRSTTGVSDPVLVRVAATTILTSPNDTFQLNVHNTSSLNLTGLTVQVLVIGF